MFLTKPIEVKLIQYNRDTDSVYDDEDKKETIIKAVFQNVDMSIRFGEYSIPEAIGYFILGVVDAKEGDQIVYDNHTYTILKVFDKWQFGKKVNIVVAVK